MTLHSGGYRLTSARRGGRKDNPTLPLSVVGVVLVIVLIIATTDSPEPERVAAAPTPTTTPTAAPPQTSPATPSPTPELRRHTGGWIDAAVEIPPTLTPTMPPLILYPTRAPRPTPRVSQCAAYRFSTVQAFAPNAHVKVDIRVDNRCPYDLGPGNLLFEISGWRDGALVQSVRGAPFETIRRGRWGELSIGLPGSEDWYDRIEVVIAD